MRLLVAKFNTTFHFLFFISSICVIIFERSTKSRLFIISKSCLSSELSEVELLRFVLILILLLPVRLVATKKEVEIYQLNSSKVVDYAVKVTATDGLNIRQGAGVKFNKLGVVPYNAVVKVTRWTSGGAYKWGLIEYDGIKGWIALDYTAEIDIDKLAVEVILGKWGNGEERKQRLGILYDDVQNRVNQMCK